MKRSKKQVEEADPCVTTAVESAQTEETTEQKSALKSTASARAPLSLTVKRRKLSALSTETTTTIPQCLVDFCAEHSIDRRQFELMWSLPRYLRVRSKFECDAVSKSVALICKPPVAELQCRIECELDAQCSATPLNDFFAVDSQSVSSCGLYKERAVVGMDLASGICARIVDPKADERVLDLCSAPGAKLEYLCELQLLDAIGSANEKMQSSMTDPMTECIDSSLPLAVPMASVGTVTGVDLSAERLQRCQKRMRDAALFNARLFAGDGCTFDGGGVECNERFATDRQFHHKYWQLDDSCLTKKQRKHRRRKGLLHASTRHRESGTLFDKVLCDAQCTHDGSLRHVRKHIGKHCGHFSVATLKKQTLSKEVISETVALQKRLISRAFELLKPGGTLVYSTCSFTQCQNEEVVRYLLDAFKDASLCDLRLESVLRSLTVQTGVGMPETVRLDPLHSGTSALFIAKISKLKAPAIEQLSDKSLITSH